MKSIGKLRLSPALRVCLAALAVWLAAGYATVHAAQPSVQTLAGGRWASLPTGPTTGVAVVDNRAYVTLGSGGLAVIDVSNPTNLLRVGGYDTTGYAASVAVLGNYAYVADYDAGLQVIDVRNPTNCVRVGGYDTRGNAWGVAVVAGRIYVADGEAGLLVQIGRAHV